MATPQNVFDLLQIDTQSDEVKAITDVYCQSREILDKTSLALGRKVEYGVFNMTSANIYNISPNDHPSTY